MRRLVTGLMVLLSIPACLAATDVNHASEAELDGIKGIGPALSGKILEARQHGPFKDWADLMRRVKGIKPKSAQQLSAAGLTVDGTTHPPAARPQAQSR